MKLNLTSRALIVDDDPDLLATMADVLRQRGYDVEVAQSAEEGLDRLSASSFQLVVSDYRLPGNTGAWMLQEAAKTGRLGTAKALLITADGHPGGVSGLKILRKPFEMNRFLGEVFELGAPNVAEELRLAAIVDCPDPPPTE